MRSAKKPENEFERVQLLKDLEILDTEMENTYDEITRLASIICDTPICLVSLVDDNRQWFKSRHGLDAAETPRELAFCSHAILENKPFIIEDAREDERFFDNPLVTEAPNVIFYAGIPLEVADGLNVGTLCAIDNKPKKLSSDQIEALQCLANQVQTQLKLRLKNKELKMAMKAKSSFFANTSHEIRTPMNGIIGMTNILLESQNDEETLQSLNVINNCCNDLLTIINDILDFSKLESGKVDLENAPFDLCNSFKQCLDLLESNAKKKDLKLQCETEFDKFWVIGDRTRFNQVIINLLSNAIKFSQNSYVNLKLKKIKEEDKLLTLQISVEDHGIGLPQEQIDKLFQPFVQAESSTSRRFGGTGLGLSICKGLVEAMGGEIWIDSVEGKGSTFHFTIKVKETEEIKLEPVKREVSLDLSFSEKYPHKILVVEDNRVNQQIMLKFLSRLGYNSDIAANGVEALECLERKNYDIIFMDCQMPVMDGFEATQEIIKIKKEEKPKIIALTASNTNEEKKKCKEVGMDEFLSKPISISRIADSLINS